MKPILAINHYDLKHTYGTLGLSELLTFLKDSDLFEIEDHNERISTLRGERATILYYNGKKVYLDFWEYPSPTWNGETYDANFDLIIKLQQRLYLPEKLEWCCQKKKTFKQKTPEERWAYYQKIVPWTFFASRLLRKYVGEEEKLHDLQKGKEIKQLGFFCGKDWHCRRHMKKKLIDSGIEYIMSKQELRHSGRPLTDPDYIDMMMTSKYGIALAGRGSFFSEAKNRREMDYMMLQKPLLLNYEPYYYNELKAGKHYILITPQTNFETLEDEYDLDEIVKNATQWYNDNASPMGAAKTFLQIMKDKFGE